MQEQIQNHWKGEGGGEGFWKKWQEKASVLQKTLFTVLFSKNISKIVNERGERVGLAPSPKSTPAMSYNPVASSAFVATISATILEIPR